MTKLGSRCPVMLAEQGSWIRKVYMANNVLASKLVFQPRFLMGVPSEFPIVACFLPRSSPGHETTSQGRLLVRSMSPKPFGTALHGLSILRPAAPVAQSSAVGRCT